MPKCGQRRRLSNCLAQPAEVVSLRSGAEERTPQSDSGSQIFPDILGLQLIAISKRLALVYSDYIESGSEMHYSKLLSSRSAQVALLDHYIQTRASQF